MSLDLTGFRLTYDDEFNSFTSSPNGSSGYKTTFYFGGRSLPSNGEQEYYSDSSVGVNPFSLSNGQLTITASPGSNPGGLAYNSGLITTEGMFTQTYGYFEIRAELPQGQGMWPAFWLLPADKSWPPEIDALEAFGQTNANGEGGATSVHVGAITSDWSTGGGGDWVTMPNGGNMYSGYHTYGVDWEPDFITYYIDGQQVYQVKTPFDANRPMYMLANLAVGGNWPGSAGGETGQMQIDYIRAFSKDGNATAIALQTVSSPDGADTSHLYGATTGDGTVPNAGTVVVRVSEDAWNGDAQFTVKVDGVQVGGIYTATALYGEGQWQDISITGSFGATGSHTVDVTFINDGWGGSPDMDRNLYVHSVTVNGQTVQGSSSTGPVDILGLDAQLWANGTASFTVSGATRDTVTSATSFALDAVTRNLTLIGTANINGTGNALDNTITGNSGNNILDGGDGNDTLSGGAGNNVLDGGTGTNTADYRGAPSGVIVNLGLGQAANGYGGTDTLRNIQTVLGSAFADTLIAGGGDRSLDGGGGNDVLFGGEQTNGASERDLALGSWSIAGIGSASGHATVLWMQDATALKLGTWQTSGSHVDTAGIYSGLAGKEWTMAGLADVNADHTTDLVLATQFYGLQQFNVWILNGTSVSAAAVLDGAIGTEWHLAGMADVNGDGKSDLVLQTQFYGLQQFNIWELNGAHLQAAAVLDGAIGTEWSLAGMADVNGDGKSDLVLQTQFYGLQQFNIWELNGTHLQAAAVLDGATGTEWTLAGMADVNGDGKSDLLLQTQHYGAEQIAVWLLDGVHMQSAAILGRSTGIDWHVLGLADVNGDGKSDILFENRTGGQVQVQVWELNGTQVIGSATYAATLTTEWHLGGIGDFNGDHKADLFWRSDSGTTQIWLLNGLTTGETSLVSGVGRDDGATTISGGSGNDTLVAGSGGDTIAGGTGDDSITLGAGNDLVVFSSGGGHDIVSGFTPGHDQIRIVGETGFAGFGDVQAHAVQAGANVVIQLDGGDTITLTSTALTSLGSTDFLFA